MCVFNIVYTTNGWDMVSGSGASFLKRPIIKN